jgi:hypothetical protein
MKNTNEVKVKMTSKTPSDHLCDVLAQTGGEIDWDGCGYTYATFPDEQSVKTFEEQANLEGILVELCDK